MTTSIVMLPTVRLAGVYAAEKADYSSVRLSNGYGMLSTAGVRVQKGITAHLSVDFEMESISTQDFKQWLDKTAHYYSDEQWHTLEENYAAGGFLGGVLAGAFGLLFGGGTYNHYKNAHDKEVKTDSEEHKGFVKSLHEVTTTHIKIHGELEATGTSLMPVEGLCFVETTSVEFKDGKTLTVVNTSDPIVAQQDGNTQGIETPGGQKLDIVPIK